MATIVFGPDPAKGESVTVPVMGTRFLYVAVEPSGDRDDYDIRWEIVKKATGYERLAAEAGQWSTDLQVYWGAPENVVGKPVVGNWDGKEIHVRVVVSSKATGEFIWLHTFVFTVEGANQPPVPAINGNLGAPDNPLRPTRPDIGVNIGLDAYRSTVPGLAAMGTWDVLSIRPARSGIRWTAFGGGFGGLEITLQFQNINVAAEADIILYLGGGLQLTSVVRTAYLAPYEDQSPKPVIRKLDPRGDTPEDALPSTYPNGPSIGLVVENIQLGTGTRWGIEVLYPRGAQFLMPGGWGIRVTTYSGPLRQPAAVRVTVRAENPHGVGEASMIVYFAATTGWPDEESGEPVDPPDPPENGDEEMTNIHTSDGRIVPVTEKQLGWLLEEGYVARPSHYLLPWTTPHTEAQLRAKLAEYEEPAPPGPDPEPPYDPPDPQPEPPQGQYVKLIPARVRAHLGVDTGIYLVASKDGGGVLEFIGEDRDRMLSMSLTANRPYIRNVHADLGYDGVDLVRVVSDVPVAACAIWQTPKDAPVSFAGFPALDG